MSALPTVPSSSSSYDLDNRYSHNTLNFVYNVNGPLPGYNIPQRPVFNVNTLPPELTPQRLTETRLQPALTLHHPSRARKTKSPSRKGRIDDHIIIKRPKNAFFFFKEEYNLSHKGDGIPQNILSKQAGLEWGGLTAEEKRHYEDMALEAKAKHERQYPGYKFKRSPKLKHATKVDRATSISLTDKGHGKQSPFASEQRLQPILPAISPAEIFPYLSLPGDPQPSSLLPYYPKTISNALASMPPSPINFGSQSPVTAIFPDTMLLSGFADDITYLEDFLSSQLLQASIYDESWNPSLSSSPHQSLPTSPAPDSSVSDPLPVTFEDILNLFPSTFTDSEMLSSDSVTDITPVPGEDYTFALDSASWNDFDAFPDQFFPYFEQSSNL